MDIEESHAELPSEEDKSKTNDPQLNPQEHNASGELLMDYDELAESTEAGTDNHSNDNVVKVGLVGGQPQDDEGGLDVSQYTGRHSKPSSQFDGSGSPFHTGPGNSTSDPEKTVPLSPEPTIDDPHPIPRNILPDNNADLDTKIDHALESKKELNEETRHDEDKLNS